MKNKIIGIVLAVIFAVMGIGILASGSDSSSAELLNVTEITSSQITSDNNYVIEEAMILDCYATMETNGSTSEWYLLIGFYDSTDTLCLTSLEMTKTDAIYQEVIDYLENDALGYGDLVLPVYASALNLTQSSEIGGYFQEYLNNMAATGITGSNLWLKLDYMGATMAEYEDQLSSDSTGSIIMGIFFLIFAVVILILSFKMKKSAKKAHTAGAAQNIYQAPPAQPQQPVYQAPQNGTVCPTCGNVVAAGTAFCGKCGTKL